MQRTEAISVGSYIDASPQIAKAAGTATKRIDGVICLAAKNIDEPFLNRALGVGTVADATPPSRLTYPSGHHASIGSRCLAIASGL